MAPVPPLLGAAPATRAINVQGDDFSGQLYVYIIVTRYLTI